VVLIRFLTSDGRKVGLVICVCGVEIGMAKK